MLRAVPNRRSEAQAIIAPAPAQMPSMAAMIGCGHARIALTRSPVIRVNASKSSMSILHQLADDVVDVAAGAEIAARSGEHDRLDVGGVDQSPGTDPATRRRTQTSLDSCARDG